MVKKNYKGKLFCFWLSIICFVLALAIPACADVMALMEPGIDDLKESAAKEIAAEFFAVKCGKEKETLLNASWDCYFGLVSKNTIHSLEPHWSLFIHRIDSDDDRWVHQIVLSGQGDLLYWNAHDNQKGYTVAEPDLLNDATCVKPLDTDVAATQIIQATRNALIETGAYSTKEAEMLTFETYFIYSEHFNCGTIPNWLVYVSKERAIQWKAFYGYNGTPISLVPYQQDFKTYNLEGENFWDNAFEDSYEEKLYMNDIIMCTMPLEERSIHMERWRPILEKWIAEHPYYLNAPGPEYEMAILNCCGVPDEQSLTQDEAIRIARAEAVRLGCAQSTVETRSAWVLSYYVTDPEHPVWNIFLDKVDRAAMSSEEYQSDVLNSSTFSISLDAYSGEVVESTATKPIIFDELGYPLEIP